MKVKPSSQQFHSDNIHTETPIIKIIIPKIIYPTKTSHKSHGISAIPLLNLWHLEEDPHFIEKNIYFESLLT